MSEADYRDEGYIVDESRIGRVYYPGENVEVTGDISVEYIVQPWISSFVVEGLKAHGPADESGEGAREPDESEGPERPEGMVFSGEVPDKIIIKDS